MSKLIDLTGLTEYDRLIKGSLAKPAGVYDTVAALTAAYPSGAQGNFVVKENNHWYYWNGSDWEDGGNYLSTANAVAEDELWAAIDFYTEKKNCPWVKEIYINEIGKNKGVMALWNYFVPTGGNSNHVMINFFVNGSGSSPTAVVYDKYDGVDYTKERFMPIWPSNTNIKTAIGYVVIDWNLAPVSNYSPTTMLLDRAYDLNCSPIIKDYLDSQRLQIEKVNDLINGDEKGTVLDELSSIPSGVSNTDFIWFPIYKWTKKINQIDYLAREGTINFYKLTINADTITKQLIASDTSINTETGKIKSVFVDVELADNEYIGLNGSFYFDEVERNYRGLNIGINDNTISGSPFPQTFYFNCWYNKNIISKIERLEELANYKNRAVLLNKKLTEQDNDFIGTQTYGANGLIVGTDLIYLNKYYSVEEREVRYVVRFGTNCIAKFESVISASSENTVVVVDIPSKQVKVNSTSYIKVPFLKSGVDFVVSVKKNYLKLEVRITQLDTGSTWKHVWERNGTGGVGEGAIGTLVDIPMQYDYYGFRTSQGNFTISQMIITAPKCDILIYGDSITEPEAYWPKNQFAHSWTQLLREMTGMKAVTSGRSGTALVALNLRIVNELPFIKPKYCMVTIGTNGAPNYNEWIALIQYIKSLDVIPIINHIPCYNNNGNTTGFIAANATIDQARAAENVKGCDFDKATSVGNDGTTLDETTMWLETYSDNSRYLHHPNIKGSERMIERMLIDIPEIFEYKTSKCKDIYQHFIFMGDDNTGRIAFSFFNNSATPITSADIKTYIKSMMDELITIPANGTIKDGHGDYCAVYAFYKTGGGYYIFASKATNIGAFITVDALSINGYYSDKVVKLN